MPGVRVIVMDELERVLLVKSNYKKEGVDDVFLGGPRRWD